MISKTSDSSSAMRRLGLFALRYGPIAAVFAAFMSLLAFDPDAVAGLRLQWLHLIASLLLLCTVFVGRALIWRQTLKRFGYPISADLALVSFNRSLLFKYLPGKVWMILSRAGYVHRVVGYPLLPLSAVSLMIQLLTVGIGFVLGILGLILVCCPIAALAFVPVFAGLLWFFSQPRRVPLSVICGLIPERMHAFLERIHLPPLAGPLVAIVAQWLFMGLAYWIFFAGCSVAVPWPSILLQAAANAAGIAAVFAPGGIGVREGVVTAYLIELGVALPLALALGLAARLWFFIAELVMFASTYAGRSSLDVPLEDIPSATTELCEHHPRKDEKNCQKS